MQTTKRMTQKDYYIAYKFLKARATMSGIKAMRVLEAVPYRQKEKIMKWLTYQHQVRFI